MHPMSPLTHLRSVRKPSQPPIVRGLTVRLLITVAALGLVAQGCLAATPPPPPPPPVKPPTTLIPFADYCASPKVEEQQQLCAQIPHTVNVVVPAGYSGLDPEFQRPFDVFSWQSFVALNWPADSQGKALPDTQIGEAPDAPRVWESYYSTSEIFTDDAPPPPQCYGSSGVGSRPAEGLVLTMMSKSGDTFSEFQESTGQPLIDRNGNFVLYDIRMNCDEVHYILTHKLQTYDGQLKFFHESKPISFPSGYYDGGADNVARVGGKVGAIEIKTAWRILDPARGDDPSRYYHTQARIEIPAENAGGTPLSFSATVGLVGFHIIHRTENQPSWVWSTFEHVDNTPECPNCQPTNGTSERRYSFYNPDALYSSPPNIPPPLKSDQKHYQWNRKPPYAGQYLYSNLGDELYGTQVVSMYPIYFETRQVNEAWRFKLRGTVWENYRLIGSQWASDEFPDDNIPLHLGNPVIETYIQPTSSCVTCHGGARTAVVKEEKGKKVHPQDANFSFLLSGAVGGPGDE